MDLFQEAGNISISAVFESNIGISVIKPENNTQPCSAGRLQNLLPFRMSILQSCEEKKCTKT